MKIVTVTLGDRADESAREGWVILNFAAPEGGRSNIGVRIAPRFDEATKAVTWPTWGSVAAELVSNMNSRLEWPKFLKQAQGTKLANQIRISCPDNLDPLVFVAEFNPLLDQNGPHQLSPPFIEIAEEKF